MASESRRAIRHFLSAMATLLLLVSVSAGAPESSPADPDVPPSGSNSIGGPAGPDTYLLPDQDGKLQKVLGFRYEDFVEAFKITNGVAEATRKPRYSLQRFVVTGRAGQAYAELHIEIGMVLNAEGPIGVSIGLSHALLRGSPTYDGLEPPLVHFDASAGEYVVWVQGTAEKGLRTLGLDVLVPLATAGDERILRLAAPRATSSRLTLQVEQPRARARVSEEAVLVSTRAVESGTELTVAGLNGQFEIGWQGEGRSPFKPSTVLESTGTILARLDGQRVICEATLTVRGFGGTFDRFVIRLPPGGQLVAISDPSYTVFPLAKQAPQEDGPKAGQLVEIRLEEATAGPIEIHCVVQQPSVADTVAPDEAAAAGQSAGSSFELGGFDVLGAVRQAGYLAVEVIGDWYVRWGELEGAIRVEDLPESLRRSDHVAGFQYYRQPFSLRGQLIRRKTSVRVEPEYLLLVGERDVALTARLRYRVRVKKIVAVELDMPGWEIGAGSIGPDDVFDVGAMTTKNGHFRIPLRSPRQGSFQLRIEATKRVAEDKERVDLVLPVPLHCLVAPSTVVVLPDDNVQLVPQSEASVGLTPQRIAPPVDLPPRQQAAFYYQGDPEKTRFVALRRTHPRAVTTRVSARVMVHADRVAVEETIAVDVAYEPLDSVNIRIPFASRSGDQIDFRLADQRLQATLSDDTDVPIDARGQAGENGPESPVVESRGGARRDGSHGSIASVALPKPTIGDFQIVARYELPRQTPLNGEKETEHLPLLVPCDVVEQTAVALKVPSPWRIAVADDDWNEQSPPQDQRSQAGNSIEVVVDGPQPFVPVEVRRADSALPRTIVDRLWVQTWLGDGLRRDRAVYRFGNQSLNRIVPLSRPDSDAVPESLGASSKEAGTEWTFSLPAGVHPDRIAVTLDGQIVTPTFNRQNELIVRAGENASDGPGCLVMIYEVSRRDRLGGPLQIDLPILEGNPWIRQTYWELLLPEDQHLVRGPAPFERENVWEMNQFFWTRRPALTTRQLEAWTGIGSEQPVPEHIHRYLFSRLGPFDHVVIWTASRAMLVLVSSGLVLVVGLLWIYLPSIRRTGFLLVLGVVLLGFGMAYPDPAILFLQASILGIVLALLAAVLRQLVGQREGASRTVVHSGGSSIVAPMTTTEIHLPAAAGEASSASTRIAVTVPPSEVAPPTDGA